MNDPTALAPSMTLISAGSRLGAHATASTDDEHALDRLASWLAEVSAEATLGPTSTDVDLASAETAPQ